MTRSRLSRPNPQKLLAYWHPPSQLVKKIQKEDHVVLSPLRLWIVGGHERDDAFAVWRDIIIPEEAHVRKFSLGPHAGLRWHEGVTLHCVRRHHDLVVPVAEKQLARVVRPLWVHTPAAGDLPFTAR